MATEKQIQSRTGTFFEVGVRYDKTMEDGQQKKVNERYVFDALSFSEAERAAVRKLEHYISGDFEIRSEAQANYTEIVLSGNPNADKFYKAKVAFITIDERTGREKRTNYNYLVQATDIMNAAYNINELFRGSMVDYVLLSLGETKVLDFFGHNSKTQDNEGQQGTTTD